VLSVLDRQIPDIILCDLRLPVMDGFELIERLRADPSRSHLPIIAVTAPRATWRLREDACRRLRRSPDEAVRYTSLVAALRTLLKGRGQKQAS
jgi:CheY-like chemotaxis protein